MEFTHSGRCRNRTFVVTFFIVTHQEGGMISHSLVAASFRHLSLMHNKDATAKCIYHNINSCIPLVKIAPHMFWSTTRLGKSTVSFLLEGANLSDSPSRQASSEEIDRIIRCNVKKCKVDFT